MDIYEFRALVSTAFPNGAIEVDNDGQLVIYTNYEYLTSEDNPTIPEGEHIIQEIEQL